MERKKIMSFKLCLGMFEHVLSRANHVMVSTIMDGLFKFLFEVMSSAVLCSFVKKQ